MFRVSTRVSSSLTLIITAYKEPDTLPRAFETARRALAETVSDYEIIIIDDASRDETSIVAGRLAHEYDAVRVVHNEQNLNQGGCYAKGITLATKEFFCLLAGDDHIEEVSLRSLFARIGEADMNLVSVTNAGVRHPIRKALSFAFVAILNTLFGYKLSYYNGPIVTRMSFMRRIAPSSSFMFAADTVVKLLSLKASYTVTPVRFKTDAKGANLWAVRRNILPVLGNISKLFWDIRIMKSVKKKYPKNIAHE